MTPPQHIAQIRRQTFWIDDDNSCLLHRNPLSSKLRRAIEHLSEGLYSKDVHFIFELIQNAEDNFYPPGVDPTLSFRLTRHDPTGTPGTDGSLIVENNELGFQPQHIEAICDVGQSTKSKQEGYIGEKGIGFKSIFQVTSAPHVFSNGYSIRLPESEPLTGLGYIVPVWLQRPAAVNLTGTTLVLPLKPGLFEELSKSLREIVPETILFLKKLKTLSISIEESYTSTVVKDDSSAPLVRVLSEIVSGELNPTSEESLFWVKTITVSKPAGISAEKRERIVDRDVSVALPLTDGAATRGDVYAFLPVVSQSGLPFIVNADFLLTSSREGIREDHPWNHWLRDSISHCFVQSFCELLTQQEHRNEAYRFLPLLADRNRPAFFDDVAAQIQSELSGKAIIIGQYRDDLMTAQEARLARKEFRALFARTTSPPRCCATLLVAQRIERFSRQLDQLGVHSVTPEEVVSCLRDVEWLRNHTLEWFADCYQYLQTIKLSEPLVAELRTCPIVPIEGPRLSSESVQPIYLGASDKDKDFLETVPQNIRAEIAFLQPRFKSLLEERPTVQSWVTDSLGIYPFSQRNYCIDIADRLNREYTTIDELSLTEGTRFLAKYFTSTDAISDLPVVLHNNRRELISTLRGPGNFQHIVTPAELDAATGWQNVFQTDEDRKHLAILSNGYAQDTTVSLDKEALRQFLISLGVTDTPLPRRHVVAEWNTSEQSEYEKACFGNTTERSTRTKMLTNPVPPQWLSRLNRGEAVEDLQLKATALLAWLRRQASLSADKRLEWAEAQVDYYYYGPHPKSYPSEFIRALKSAAWLPTTTGFVVPKTAFVRDGTIYAVLGDAVPYLSGELPEWAVDLLEVRRTAAPKDLVGALTAHAEAGAQNATLALKVYQLLDHLSVAKSLCKEFSDKSFIHVPHHGRGWFRTREVVWADRSETFGDAFAYLEPAYPKMREFFVEHLGVKADVDAESFANRWVALAQQSACNGMELEGPMTQIFQALLPQCRRIQSGESPPSWWPEFSREVRFWCHDGVFRSPVECYVADDGEVRRLFANSEVAFVWRPEKSSYAEIADLYRALRARFLSEHLAITCLNSGGGRVSQPRFLTRAAKALVWAWAANTLEAEQYQRIHDSGILNALTETTEASVQKLSILFTLDNFIVRGERIAYWDLKNRRLLFEEAADREVVRQEIAEAIARGIMRNRPYREVESFVFQMLCADSARARSYISRRDWSLPAEPKSVLHGGGPGLSSPPERETADQEDPTLHGDLKEGGAESEQAGSVHDGVDLDSDDDGQRTGGEYQTPDVASSGQAGHGTRGSGGSAAAFAAAGQHTQAPSTSNSFGSNSSFSAGNSGNNRGLGALRFVSYVSVEASSRRDDVDGSSVEHRREVEEAAVRFVLDLEKHLVTMPYGNEGFDLCERDETDNPKRWVEVKGISGPWKGREVVLTHPEFECARLHRTNYWLYVVENATDPVQRRLFRIQDPAGQARNFKFDHGWSSVGQ